ncbi:MAG: DUF1957 domain-containing protein [Planctomycetota bacterium]|jgi:1,4-alpha-glucan branching enzyme|nr:DUF1957 domain-containing protein [Planctomycetota bacterium]
MDSTRPKGYLAVVLHAHLPYVRHPEHENFLEELWFYEALAETYIPLLQVLNRLERDGVGYRLLLSLSPTLVSMFENPLLQERFVRHLRRVIRLADREAARSGKRSERGALCIHYADRYRDILHWFEDRCGRRLAPAFARLAEYGNLEIMTCGATHGFLPILQQNPGAVRAQAETARDYHAAVFGSAPDGIWTPECAYYSGLESVLAEAGFAYTLVDSHAVENAGTAPRYGVYAPICSREGVAFFGRDRETGYQVWSAEQGYPGHPNYREFYRDLGYELPEEELGEFLIDGRIRVNTGLKLNRITSREGGDKAAYNPEWAREQAARDAGHFVENRVRQAENLARAMTDRPPIIVAPYDAELFGHWWHEGPMFLEYVFRKLHYDQNAVETLTPRAYLLRHPENQRSLPAGSSWGGDGTYEFWVNGSNQDIIPALHQAADRFTAAVDRDEAAGLDPELLKQMQRELMLAQASDWPFIMRTGTSPEYAGKRVRDHLSRFWALENMLINGIDEEAFAAIRYADDIFPDCKPEYYASRPPGAA